MKKVTKQLLIVLTLVLTVGVIAKLYHKENKNLALIDPPNEIQTQVVDPQVIDPPNE